MNKNFSYKVCTPNEWGRAISFISMDVTELYWKYINFIPSIGIQKAKEDIRELIIRYREHVSRNIEKDKNIGRFIYDDNMLFWSDCDLEMLLLTVSKKLKTDHSENQHISAWSIALTYFPEWFPKTIDALEKENRSILVDKVNEVMNVKEIKEYEVRNLTTWDFSICARHGWNLHSDEGFPPIDYLERAVDLERTCEAISFFGSQTSLSTQKIFYVEAKKCIEYLDVWMSENLNVLYLRINNEN